MDRVGLSGWRYVGTPDGRFTYLSVSRLVALTPGQRVIVHGNIRRGGILVGFLARPAVGRDVVAADDGEFWATLEAPFAGRFQVVIANEIPEGDVSQDVVVEDVRVG